MALQLGGGGHAGQRPQLDRGTCAAVLTGERPLGDLPLIVVTAGQRAAPGATSFDDGRVPADPAIIRAQAALTTLSSRGEQRFVEESGHQVHLDAPEAVILAVRDVVDRAQ